MKRDLFKRLLLAICFIPLTLNRAGAQESVELPEIKGSYSQVYQEFKIEVTGIKRLKQYQPVWRESGRPRGHKIVAEPDSEIALVQLKVQRLGNKNGIGISHLYLYDSNNREFEAQTRAFVLGASDKPALNSKNDNYEFPVMIPKGLRFSAVQLRHISVKETQPLTVCQKITFDISPFSW